MDPDYRLPQTVIEEANKRRNKEKCEQIERAKLRVQEDFEKEFGKREEQLIEIQNRITCLAKTLHVLRYVLVSDFYNKQEAQLQLSEEDLKLVDKQQRLHPAIKRLASERELSNLDFGRRKSRRTLRQKPVASISMKETLENIRIKNDLGQPAVNTAPEETAAMPRNRHMVKRRIIVGNISKWMPSDNPEDCSTHKWMVYVRGPPENPRIDDFVKKITFHLHPSYHPHDVIDLKSHPFHLTRRGWGEFPIRCQIVFKSALNKPVDVIHHLKLDKTYSGRQTLGNETVVELTLYDKNAVQNNPPDTPAQTTTTETSNSLSPFETPSESMETSEGLLDTSTMSAASSVSEPIAKAPCTEKIDKQLLVDDYSHSVPIKKEILDPSYMDVESIDILEHGVTEDTSVQDDKEYSYYDQCPALWDHTYSLRCVKSC